MGNDFRDYHKLLLGRLKNSLKGNKEKLHLKKKTVSNLFRYEGRRTVSSRDVDLSQFNKVLFLDAKYLTLEVQGLATYEQIVDSVLPSGLLPLITPELKHITIGGATVGIGIESNSYKFGFVHNGLLEADVLLSDGSIVTCSETAHRDLFYALANSYGTLGYILRVKIKLRAALAYMKLTTRRFASTEALLKAMKDAASDPQIDSIESLVYTKNEMYLTTAVQSDTPENLMNIYGKTIFYKEISKVGVLSLTTKDFLFRYDPEWFWNVPQSFIFTVFRICAPRNMRNSGFYTKYGKNISSLLSQQTDAIKREQLIQDWEVPWKYATVLLTFFLSHIDLCGLPILVAPVKVQKSATLYPMKKNELYFNLGSYSFVKKIKAAPSFETTKIIDAFCFNHEGIKMLYSSSFLTETEFSRIYNGAAYAKLKRQYDPKNRLPSLFEKTVQAK